MLDFEACYRAVRSRDSRFDGVFFTGVTSTGIYCRPSCPAMTPKRANVRFYRSAAEAQSAGFRACRRCRPDVTPGAPQWNIRADLAGRAMRLVSDGVVDREGVAGLAQRLGYSERQVHRTLADEVGAGPLRLARAQRAHTARLLLETTDLPVTEIAYAAGFASIRQFNDTVREVYATTPTDLRGRSRRGRHRKPPVAGAIELRLAHRQPADLDSVLAFLAARAVPGVEEVDGRTYRRSLVLPHGVGIAELTPADGFLRGTLRLADPRDLASAVARCRRLFDLDADSSAVDEVLASNPALAGQVASMPGLRVPGVVDGDELAVRAVLGQQISVAAARALAGRLVLAYGKPLDAPAGGVTHAFPTAAALAGADPAVFPMPARRQRTLHEVTSRLADGRLRLDPGADRDDAERTLLAVPGIGPWTVAYIRMRALSDPDVFMATDLGVRQGMARAGLPDDPAGAAVAAQLWRPWRSYAQMHLWILAAGTTSQRRLVRAGRRESPAHGPVRPDNSKKGNHLMTTYWTSVDSPLGPLLLTADDEGLTGLHMERFAHGPVDDDDGVGADWVQDAGRFADARRQLEEYFAGNRTAFDLPLHPSGTPFQQQVWQALLTIPYGEVRSYGEIAEQIGRRGASRAVGLANGRNPIAVIVPCHRVIGASGSLTGYGGGLERKRLLLDLESGAAGQKPLLSAATS